MTWYDTKLNPVDNPPNDKNSYIHIQKPHTRTLRLYVRETGLIHKKVKLPWTIFICVQKYGDFYFFLSNEMPGLDTQLYRTMSPNICGYICMERFNHFYNEDEDTPQNRLDYLWSSAFPFGASVDENDVQIGPEYNLKVGFTIRKLI